MGVIGAVSMAAWSALASPGWAEPVVVGRVQAVAPADPFPGACPPYEGEPGTAGAQYEPYLAVDPGDRSRLVAAWIQDGGLSIVSAFSRDGGLSWSRVLMPGASHCTGGNTGGAVNPWLSFAPDRTLYEVQLGADIDSLFPLTNANSQVTVNLSGKSGASWSAPVFVQPQDGSYYDKPTVTADPLVRGRAYAVWGKRSGPTGASGVTFFSSTSDGGRAWSTPRQIYDPGPAPYPQWSHGDVITVLPDGSLLDVFGVMNNSPFITPTAPLPNAIMAMRSTDAGHTWSVPTTIAQVPSRFADDGGNSGATRLITLPIPSVAVTADGQVYAAWHENPTQTSGRILISRSGDHGRTWSVPHTIDAPGSQAFLPALAAGPKGELGVLFYDTRDDTPGDGKLTTDLWFAHSRDRGNSWQQTHVAGPFDALSAPNFFNQGHLLGDSIALAPASDGFQGIFTLAQPIASSAPSTVFFSHIRTRPPPRPAHRRPLIVLARRRSCHSRGQLSVYLRVVHGERIISVSVTVNGKARIHRHLRGAVARIDLRGLPRGRITVRVTAHSNRGRTVHLARRYRACTRKRHARR
jgi:BNR repeat-like domain